MRSKSFYAKTLKLYFGQNSWPIGARGIFEQILIEFLAIDFSICFLDL